MNAEAIVAVSAAVVALTQLVKWSGVDDKHGAWAVLILSLLGTVFWGWSNEAMTRRTAFEFFAGWITVATSAAFAVVEGYAFARNVNSFIVLVGIGTMVRSALQQQKIPWLEVPPT